MLTRDADLNDFEFKGRGSGSSTKSGGENYRADGAMNVPLIEGKLAARAVVGYADLSGWISRPNERNANDAKLHNYRLKVNAHPSESLSVELSTWSSRSDFGAPSMSLDDRTYSIPVDEPMSTDYEAYGFTVGYDFADVTLTSMTSYLDYANSGVLNVLPLGLPNTPFVNKYFAHLFAQEFNLSSTVGESWRWSAGGIYRDATDRTYQTIAGVTPGPLDSDDTSKSYAVFGEVTRLFLNQRLELTAGLRYFRDRVRTHETDVSYTGDPSVPLVDASSQFEKTTPRIILNWHANEEVTAYASYSEGFRSGFQQQPNVIGGNPEIPPVRADSLKNYELGTKGRFMSGRLELDAAIYYLDWQDVQSDNSVIQFGVPVLALTNGESASGIGFDIAATGRPVSSLALGLSFSTNQLEWDEAVINDGDVLFASGDRLSLSPQHTVGGSADYTFPLVGGGYSATLSASANYTSKQYMKFATGFGQADSILIARASLAVESPSRWTVMLFADNLNDEDGIIQKAPFPVPDWALRPRPRTIGMQVEDRFE